MVFLRRLASMYDNSRIGNPALAEALYELADSLADQTRHATQELPFKEVMTTPSLQLRGHDLDLDAVARFVSDESKTKQELVELATARFSIPRSGLMRMKTSDVREAIRTALLHEKSISIIAEEAHRSGANRKS